MFQDTARERYPVKGECGGQCGSTADDSTVAVVGDRNPDAARAPFRRPLGTRSAARDFAWLRSAPQNSLSQALLWSALVNSTLLRNAPRRSAVLCCSALLGAGVNKSIPPGVAQGPLRATPLVSENKSTPLLPPHLG